MKNFMYSLCTVFSFVLGFILIKKYASKKDDIYAGSDKIWVL